MSEQASAGPSSESSESDEVGFHLLQLQQSQQPSKKRYVPPKADSDTFPNQKAFLDSLQPMSIDDVDANSRKCPICWKSFGEAPDPGFDNSELPVKLRCNHVFGDKCLTSTFGQEFRVRIKPLSFATSSNGQLLGEKLHAFCTQNEADSKNDVEMFEKMIEDAGQQRKGVELFGRYWGPIMRHLQHGDRQISDITFMENAVITDVGHKRPHYAHSFGGSQHMSNNIDVTVGAYSGFPEEATPAKIIPALSQPFSVEPVTMDHLFLPVLSATPSPIHSSLTAPPVPPFDPHMPEIYHAESSHGDTKTWKGVLANKTNLDKLSELQKEKLKAQQIPASGSSTQAGETISDPVQKAWEAQMEASNKLAEQRRLSSERNKQTLRTLIAQKLASTYAEYREKWPQADPAKSTDRALQSVPTMVILHSHEYQKLSYEIEAPSAMMLEDFDAFPKDDEHEPDLIESTFFIKRSVCASCSRPKDHNTQNAKLSTPNELTWLGHSNSPDSCPLCHKVLFKSWRTRR